MVCLYDRRYFTLRPNPPADAHWIHAPAGEGIAAQDPPPGHRHSAQHTMNGHSLEAVGRAARIEAAHLTVQGGDGSAIGPNEQSQNPGRDRAERSPAPTSQLQIIGKRTGHTGLLPDLHVVVPMPDPHCMDARGQRYLRLHPTLFRIGHGPAPVQTAAAPSERLAEPPNGPARAASHGPPPPPQAAP